MSRESSVLPVSDRIFAKVADAMESDLRESATVQAFPVPDQGRRASVALKPADHVGLDEFDHQMRRHKADLQAIEAQISKLDDAIDQEQQRLHDLRDSLDQKYHSRARLTHLRQAMEQFVQTLKTSEDE